MTASGRIPWNPGRIGHMSGTEAPVLLAVWHGPAGELSALVTGTSRVTACGITAGRVWWCECGLRTDGTGAYVSPAAVCAHLRALGTAPAEAAG